MYGGKSNATSPNQTKNFKPFSALASLIFGSGRGVRNVIRQAQADENTGSITTGPLSNIRFSLSAVWTLALTSRQGEGRAKPDSPAHPSQPPELIEKTWSPGPPPLHPSWLIPSIPQFHYPSRPGVHFIKHTTMHSNKPRQSTGLTTPRQKCNPNNLVHSELMCSFTYQIDPIPEQVTLPALICIYHSVAGPLTIRHIT